MAQLPFQWPVNLFKGSLRKDTYNGLIVATRHFHASTTVFAESDSTKGRPSPQSGRTAKSQDAFNEVRRLPYKPVGLRGGMFKNDPAVGNPAPPHRELNRSNPAPGNLLTRRIQGQDSTQRTPIRGGPLRGGPLRGARGGAFRGGRGGPAGSGRGGSIRAGQLNPESSPFGETRPSSGKRTRYAANTAPIPLREQDDLDALGFDDLDGMSMHDNAEGKEDAAEEDGDDEAGAEYMMTPGDFFSDKMVRFLREEHEDKKGNKPYYPVQAKTEELVGLTESSLPALPGQDVSKTMTHYLSGTVPEHFGPEPFMGMLHPGQEKAKRLIQGLPVKYVNESEYKSSIDRAQGKKLKDIREAQETEMKAEGIQPAKEIKFAPLPAKLRHKTEQRVLTGQYELNNLSEGMSQRDLLKETAQRGLLTNASYRTKDQDAFMNVVNGLLDGKPSGKAPLMGLT